MWNCVLYSQPQLNFMIKPLGLLLDRNEKVIFT
jgi:hypothetical protein